MQPWSASTSLVAARGARTTSLFAPCLLSSGSSQFYIPGGIRDIQRLSLERACAGTRSALPAHQGQQHVATDAACQDGGMGTTVVHVLPTTMDRLLALLQAIMAAEPQPQAPSPQPHTGMPPWTAAAAMAQGQHPSCPLPPLQRPYMIISSRLLPATMGAAPWAPSPQPS